MGMSVEHSKEIYEFFWHTQILREIRGGVESNRTNFELILIEFFE